MGGSSRFDTLRILLPGAILITLVDFGARLTASATATRASSEGFVRTAQSFVDFVEDPFRGIVLAFGMGLVLYFVNPAYATPQYWKGIPSEVVVEKVKEADFQGVSGTDLYFLALNELMPVALRDRALLYGQMYRIGFEMVFYALLTAVATATSALVVVGGSVSDFRVTTGGWMLLAVLILEAGVFMFRMNRASPHLSKWSYQIPVSLLALIPVGGWFAMSRLPETTGTLILVSSSVGAAAVWTLLRLKGGAWPSYVTSPTRRGTSPFRTADPHSAFEILVLDIAFVVPWLLLMAGSGEALTLLHLGSPILLTAAALLLSHLRKYERQNHGVYRNQKLWIELN